MAQAEIIKTLQLYIRLLNEAGLKIKKAFLFRSFARNEAKIDSDIDVMLVSDHFDNNDIEYKAKAWQLKNKVDARIEPFAVGSKYFFANNDSALLNQIKKMTLK